MRTDPPLIEPENQKETETASSQKDRHLTVSEIYDQFEEIPVEQAIYAPTDNHRRANQVRSLLERFAQDNKSSAFIPDELLTKTLDYKHPFMTVNKILQGKGAKNTDYQKRIFDAVVARVVSHKGRKGVLLLKPHLIPSKTILQQFDISPSPVQTETEKMRELEEYAKRSRQRDNEARDRN